MSRRAWLSGCIGALILWLVIGLIFAAGLAVGRATASVPFRWSPAPWSASAPSVFLGVDESARARSGAPLGTSRINPRLSDPLDGSRLGAGVEDSNPASGTPSPAVVQRIPVARPPATLVGWASFYDAGPGEYAALPGFRTSQLGMHVVVCAFPDGRANCITAAVVTSCGCKGPPRKIIDLSPALFEAVSGMTAAERWIYGVVRVTVQVIR